MHFPITRTRPNFTQKGVIRMNCVVHSAATVRAVREQGILSGFKDLENPSPWINALWVVSLEVNRTEIVSLHVLGWSAGKYWHPKAATHTRVEHPEKPLQKWRGFGALGRGFWRGLWDREDTGWKIRAKSAPVSGTNSVPFAVSENPCPNPCHEIENLLKLQP